MAFEVLGLGLIWGFSKIRGPFLASPYKKDANIFGVYIGVPLFKETWFWI